MVVISLPAASASVHRAGARRDAVDMHRAGAALRDAAAVLGAGHAERVAQHPQQRGVGLDLDVVALAIDDESWHCGPPVMLPDEGAKLGAQAAGVVEDTIRALAASLACFDSNENSQSGDDTEM